MDEKSHPLVAVLMGSSSDWETMKKADEMLDSFGIPHECRVLSAHRSPQLAVDYIRQAETRGVEVILAGAGGAAHLAGLAAAHSLLPVIGVPHGGGALSGIDALLSTVQMPAGVPVAAMAIGEAGACNAALFAVAILARSRPPLVEKLRQFREEQARNVGAARLP